MPKPTKKRNGKARAHSDVIKIDLLLVEWKDAMSSGLAWAEPDQVKTMLGTCVTLGYMVAEDDEAITMAQNVSFSTGHFGQLMNIPKHSIQRVRKLGRIIAERDNG